MSRPKKDFIPTSLSDLNIDSISLGSNGDRHNNNSNGANFSNLNRSKATSSFNLASHKKSQNSNISNSSFGRSSKLYGSQTNLSAKRNVNNYDLNSPTSSVDRWEQAWDDNNSASAYQQQYSNDKTHSIKHSHTTSFDFKRSSNNHSESTANRSINYYSDDPFSTRHDPFDDPWSGIFSAILLLSSCAQLHTRNFIFL